MKKAKRVLLAATGILVIVVAFILVTQAENIKAIILAMQYSDNEIEDKISENDEILKKYLDMQTELGGYTAGDDACNQTNQGSQTDSSQTQTESGANDYQDNNTGSKNDGQSNENPSNKQNNQQNEQTNNQINQNNQSIGQSNSSQESQGQNNGSNKNNQASGNNSQIISSSDSAVDEAAKKQKELISSYINKMMAVKLEFTGLLGDLEKKVYDEYKKLAENQKDFEHKKDIVLKYYSYVADLEKQCDKKVADITTSLKKELEDLKLPTDAVDDINKVYENEKALKKAYYISLYKDNKK